MSTVPILAYHNVGRSPGGSYALLYVGVEQLDRQMWTLRRLGLRGVSMEAGLSDLASNARSRRVVLTFDDGYIDTLTQAAPILRRYGFTATCYVVADAIGSWNRWDDETLGEKKPLMDPSGIRAWLDAGMEIGSHSCTHPRLPGKDEVFLEREVASSRAILRERFGVPVDHFAYPFGAFDESTVALVRRAGYRSAVTTLAGRARRADDPYRLPRLLVEGTSGLASFVVRTTTPWVALRQKASTQPGRVR